MRLLAPLLIALVFAAPASAATPRFGVFSLTSDLAPASHNAFGDVRVMGRDVLARKAPDATLVRCAANCRLGHGWVAFSKRSSLRAADLVAARASSGQRGWKVTITLSPAGMQRWRTFSAAAAARAKANGVPDALVVVVQGRVLAQPYSNDVRRDGSTLRLTGFFKADALRVAKLLG